MCLSTVYLDRKDASTVVMREAAQVANTGAGVQIATLFGERRSIDGYSVGEVNLMDNTIVLVKTGPARGGE